MLMYNYIYTYIQQFVSDDGNTYFMSSRKTVLEYEQHTYCI